MSVWIGLDVGKSEHFADVLDDNGERLFARAVANDQADLELPACAAPRRKPPATASEPRANATTPP
ncbi:MAG TPA: transposase [Streptosporangiaceae bacterium]|nr:transposase [Streptosporangiaceae bacterium]